MASLKRSQSQSKSDEKLVRVSSFHFNVLFLCGTKRRRLRLDKGKSRTNKYVRLLYPKTLTLLFAAQLNFALHGWIRLFGVCRDEVDFRDGLDVALLHMLVCGGGRNKSAVDLICQPFLQF